MLQESKEPINFLLTFVIVVNLGLYIQRTWHKRTYSRLSKHIHTRQVKVNEFFLPCLFLSPTVSAWLIRVCYIIYIIYIYIIYVRGMNSSFN